MFDMFHRPQRLIVQAAIVATGIAVIYLGINALVAMFGPVVSVEKLNQIKGGTKSDVLRVLGTPSNGSTEETWYLDKPWNFGWVAISFDGDRVGAINDESVFRATFP